MSSACRSRSRTAKETEARLDASNSLLEAISRSLMMFIADGHPAPALDHLLNNVVTLTQSEYRFVGEVLWTAKEQPYLKYHAAVGSRGPANGGSVPCRGTAAERRGHERGMHRGGADGSTIYRQRRFRARRGPGRGKGTGACESLLAMPLYRGAKLVGIVAVANRPKGYSEELPVSLEPFCTTCATIIDGHRNALRRRHAEDALQKLNEDLECRVQERTAELEAANRDLQNEIVLRERDKEALAHHQAHIESLNERLRRSMQTHHRVKNSLQMIAAMVDMHLMEGQRLLVTLAQDDLVLQPRLAASSSP